MRVSSRESLAELLKRLRAQAGMSQEELAARSGLSLRAISYIETGLRRRSRAATIRLLADALALNPDLRLLLQRVAQQDGLYLPVPPVLVGRDDAVSRLQAACADHALVSVTGPPGVGKTSVALRFANDSLDQYPGGVAFVPLDTIDDATLVLSMIARSLGLEVGDGGSELRNIVLERLRIARTLLVLDNIEHVLDVAPFIAALLDEAPLACVLATGRAPFDLSTELELPLAELSLKAAVALFVKIAASVVNGYAPDATELEHIERICAQLDRLPLALELAAVRLRSLSYAQVAGRLWDLLYSASADRTDRHRALDAAIRWSYDLLSEDVQMALRGFAIFPSGATAEDALAVCGMNARTIEALVRQNLLIAEGYGPGRRLRMLVTIRAFMLARLCESSEFADVGRRHATHMCEVAESLTGRSVKTLPLCMTRFEERQEDFRAALEWSVSAQAWEIGIRIACALRAFWRMSNQHRDALHWFKTLSLATSAIADRRLRFRLVKDTIEPLILHGDINQAEQYVQELVEIASSLNDPLIRAWSLVSLEMIDFASGRRDAVRDLRSFVEEADIDDGGLLSLAYFSLARSADPKSNDALLYYELAIRHASSAGLDNARAHLLANFGDCLTMRGEYERAEEVLTQAGDLAVALDFPLVCAHAQLNRAQLFLALGKTESARLDLVQSLEFFSGMQYPLFMAYCLEEAARLFAALKADERQTMALALAERHYGRRAPDFLLRREADLRRLRAELGDKQFHANWKLGRTLRIDEVLQMLDEAGASLGALTG